MTFDPGILDQPSEKGTPARLKQLLGRGARFVHANPYALRQPSKLLPGAEIPEFFDEQGLGLPSIYDALMTRGDDSFATIRDSVRKLFPGIRSFGVRLVKEGVKELHAELVTGERVPARNLSEGFLYYLLFAALRHLDRAAVLLVEEPENGLHPARIADVVRVLREISKETQVLIATHSPLVINELRPDEVSLTVRPPQKGTQVIPMTKTRYFEDRSKAFALGELWLSYADGELECELFGEG